MLNKIVKELYNWGVVFFKSFAGISFGLGFLDGFKFVRMDLILELLMVIWERCLCMLIVEWEFGGGGLLVFLLKIDWK